MSYFESQEERKLRRLQQKAGFNVNDYIKDKAIDLFDSLDQEDMTNYLMEKMSVTNIDGEALNKALNYFTYQQAISELEKTIEYNEQMRIDKSLY